MIDEFGFDEMWDLEEWAELTNDPYSGGENGLKWYRWMRRTFGNGFVANRLDAPPLAFPELVIPFENISQVSVRGLDPVIRFTQIPPYKEFIWVIQSITSREDGSREVQILRPGSTDNPQQWLMVPLTDEQWLAMHPDGDVEL